MKPIHVATLLLRYGCIWAFIDGAITLVELPADIYGILNAQADYLVTQREIALAMMLVRFLFYVVPAILFLIFTRPIARFLAKVFEDDNSAI
jgi:hypothetical protein